MKKISHKKKIFTSKKEKLFKKYINRPSKDNKVFREKKLRNKSIGGIILLTTKWISCPF